MRMVSPRSSSCFSVHFLSIWECWFQHKKHFPCSYVLWLLPPLLLLQVSEQLRFLSLYWHNVFQPKVDQRRHLCARLSRSQRDKWKSENGMHVKYVFRLARYWLNFLPSVLQRLRSLKTMLSYDDAYSDFPFPPERKVGLQDMTASPSHMTNNRRHWQAQRQNSL